MTESDVEELFQEINQKVPLTRIYLNNKIEYEVGGVLYHSQVKDLFAKAAEFGLVNENGKKIKSEQSFNVIQAKQKDINVQAFQASDFLNVELLGQEVIARKGQWIVLYPDNHIEVLDDTQFIRRSE